MGNKCPSCPGMTDDGIGIDWAGARIEFCSRWCLWHWMKKAVSDDRIRRMSQIGRVLGTQLAGEMLLDATKASREEV